MSQSSLLSFEDATAFGVLFLIRFLVLVVIAMFLRDDLIAKALVVRESGCGVCDVVVCVCVVLFDVEVSEAIVENRALSLLVIERGDEVPSRALDQWRERLVGLDGRDGDLLVDVFDVGREQVIWEDV